MSRRWMEEKKGGKVSEGEKEEKNQTKGRQERVHETISWKTVLERGKWITQHFSSYFLNRCFTLNIRIPDEVSLHHCHQVSSKYRGRCFLGTDYRAKREKGWSQDGGEGRKWKAHRFLSTQVSVFFLCFSFIIFAFPSLLACNMHNYFLFYFDTKYHIKLKMFEDL